MSGLLGITMIVIGRCVLFDPRVRVLVHPQFRNLNMFCKNGKAKRIANFFTLLKAQWPAEPSTIVLDELHKY